MSNLSDITVAILAGGLGKRLRSKVSDRPKVLAQVNNQPFLQYLLDQLNSAGFRSVVICTGYLGNQIKEKFGKNYKNLKITYSQEESPLGTGGGLRLALPFIKSKIILVMNGDSFCDVHLKEFLNFYSQKKADASLVLTYVEDTQRFGKINADSLGGILGFEEKKKGIGPGWINAGIYLIKRSLISEIPKGINISLEKKIFPKWIDKIFYGYKGKGRFIDIGTPNSYKQAENFFKKRFVLLDQDGTIIVEKNYLSNPDGVELIPGVAEALKKLKEMGLGLVVITNQSGVGRGYFNMITLKKIHQRMNKLLAKEGIALDDIYFCPHTPDDNCLCRKPNAGLVEQAMQKHNFDPNLCFVIGDKKADIELGQRIGATTILVRTGYGVEVEKEKIIKPDWIVDDLVKASEIIQTLI